jgi:hypothetical protein
MIIPVEREDIEKAYNKTSDGFNRDATAILRRILHANPIQNDDCPDPKEEVRKKILVNADELNKVFDIVANVKHHVTPYDPVWIVEQLQKACDILGPMWVHGVNESKPVDFHGFKQPATGDDTERIERHRTEHFNTAARIRQHKEAIVEILDMLAQYTCDYVKTSSDCARLNKHASTLKAKLAGKK